MKVKSLSHVRLFATPWTVAYQIPPSMGFSRKEYWSGLPIPSPRKNKGIAKKIFFCFNDYAKGFDCVDHKKLWKILKEMGLSDHLTCILRSLYVGQEATVRSRHGTTDWFKIGKGVHLGHILSLCLINLNAEYIIWNAELDEAQAGISRLLGEISTSDMQMISL